jgi:hypothetical protein
VQDVAEAARRAGLPVERITRFVDADNRLRRVHDTKVGSAAPDEKRTGGLRRPPRTTEEKS